MAQGAGTAIIYATAQDGSGKRSCCTVTVEAEIFNNLIANGTISAADIECTGDGLFILNISLSDVLIKNGVFCLYKSTDGKDTRDVTKYYDDWYLFAVETGSTTKYGLYKMREQEYDSDDGNDPGVTISFVGLNMNAFNTCLNSPTQTNTFNLLQELNKVTGPGIYDHDEDIVAYFAKTESKGAYLIAEKYVSFIAQTSVNGILNVPDNFVSMLMNESSKLTRLLDWLAQNNENAGYNVYDESTHTISICNVNNLSIYEKYAILATFTADVNFNSFAAEVEFHADAVNDWKADIPLGIGDKWYEAALRADMSISEEEDSGFFDEYYDLESSLVQAQAEIHGNY